MNQAGALQPRRDRLLILEHGLKRGLPYLLAAFSAALLLLFRATALAPANDPQPSAPVKAVIAPQARSRIPVGEQLYYSATWRLWPAGNAMLTLGRRGVDREITFSAVSTGVVSVLFPVRDQIESFYDQNNFCTRSVRKNTLEGRRKLRTRIVYHLLRHKLTLQETNLSGPRPRYKHSQQAIPGCVLDLFTALYYVRQLPLKLNEVYNFPVNEGGKTVEVRLIPDLKETVITPAGTFHTLRAEPHIFNTAVFHRPGRMWIWFSDDRLHLPVMVKAQVSWGTIIAHLTRYEEPH